MQTVEEPVLTPDSAAGGHESLIRCENSRAPLEPRAKDVLPNRQLLEVIKLNKQHQIGNCFWGLRQVSKWRNETADFLPPLGEILPFLVLISPQCRRKKSSEEKHTNLFPISFLISAENDVLWPAISLNSFIWVIIMDIVIFSEPDSSRWMWAEGRGGGATRVSRRMDVKLWWGCGHYSDIPLFATVLPLSADFNLSRADWQPHRGPFTDPAWTFTISFSSWHVYLSRKIFWSQFIFNPPSMYS